MKLFFFVACILSASVTHSQNCSSGILMKQGARLEYQSYFPKTNLFGKLKGYHKTSKLIFTVNTVKDSGSNTVSYITKQGIATKNPKKTYTKEIVLACNEKFLRIPFDLFNADTTFLADIYPAGKKWGIFTAHASVDRPSFLFIPHVLEGVRELNIDKSSNNFEFTIHDFMPGDYTANNRIGYLPKTPQRPGKIPVAEQKPPSNASYHMGTLNQKLEIRISKVYVDGKETINTPAGSFNCFKIVLLTEMTIMERSGPANYIMYYDPAIGCIKFEVSNSMVGGYVELTGITR